MSDTVIKVENICKEYRLGTISHGTLYRDLQSWTARIIGKEDPNTQIGHAGSRVQSGIFKALDNVSFEVKQGEVLGVIGRNGAGKSTLLKIISQVTGPSSGTIKIKGRIASLLEVGTGFHPELTGRENVFLNGAILGMSKEEIRRKFDEIVAFAEIDKFIDTPVKRYSSGMYVRLAFAVAAHLEPEILIVDEVLAVGDAQFQKKCLGKMQEIGKEGRTVLFVSHNMGAIKNLCDRVLLIEKGNLALTDSSSSAISHYLSSFNNIEVSHCIETIAERSGSGKIIFSDFFIEDAHGNRVKKILTGDDVVFVFRLKAIDSYSGKLDLGFSLHNQLGDMLSVLYSSYQNTLFELNEMKCFNIRCKVMNFPFVCSRLIVKGRLVLDGDEADWPKVPLGYVDIESGDFFKTGSPGFEGNSSFLVKGEWEYNVS